MVDLLFVLGGLGFGVFVVVGVVVVCLVCLKSGVWVGVCFWIGYVVNGSQFVVVYCC